MRFIFLLLMSLKLASACALCALFTPTAHITLDLNSSNNTIKNAKISWHFSQNFTDITLQSYDVNSNKILDKDELEEITRAIVDYALNKNMLLYFEFYDQDSKSIRVFDGYSNFKSQVINNRLVFTFDKKLDIDIKDNRVLKVVAKDDEGYFNFTFVQSGATKLNDVFFAVTNSNLGATFIEIKKNFKTIKQSKTLEEIVNEKNAHLDELESQKIGFFAKNTIKFTDYLKDIFKKNSQNNDIFGILAIIAVSFLYGMLHAAGPGHAKILTTSYFLSTGGNWKRASLFALKVGFFHVIGAFVIVLISMFLIDIISHSLKANTAAITTKISAVVIICISIFIMIDKLIKNNTKKVHCCSCCIKFKQIQYKQKNWSNLKPQTPNKNIKFDIISNRQNEYLMALAASIIPCPGTILVFVFAFNLGSYITSIISAISMSIGMGCVIFIAAIFGAKINNFSKFKKIRPAIEYFGIFMILALGIYMYFISERIGIL